MVARQKHPPNVFGGCWTDVDADSPAQMRRAENEFAVLLRMRACDVFALLDRAEQLAKRMRSTRLGLPRVDGVRVCAGVARWLFEALSRNLVRVPTRDMEDAANALRLRGQVQLKRGQELVADAEDTLSEVEGYNPATGTARLSPALLGIAYVRQAKRKMAAADGAKRRGLVMIAQGQTLTRRADAMLPSIEVNEEIRRYFQSAYGLARTANSLSPKEEALLARYDQL
jgi:hypothetical protein